MPLCVVSRDPHRIKDALLFKITYALPKVIAEALDVPDLPAGRLLPGDVEVWVQDTQPFDQNPADLAIVIWANKYPARLESLDKRRQEIVEAMRPHVPKGLKAFVWVLLADASFGEF